MLWLTKIGVTTDLEKKKNIVEVFVHLRLGYAEGGVQESVCHCVMMCFASVCHLDKDVQDKIPSTKLLCLNHISI